MAGSWGFGAPQLPAPTLNPDARNAATHTFNIGVAAVKFS